MSKDRTERVELTTMVMVTDAQGRLLVQNRLDPEWGGLCFPGGHVEPGESFVRSAIREVYEETGLAIENPTLCGIKQFPIKGGRYIVLFFKSDRFSGDLRDSEEGPVFWLERSQLQKYRTVDKFWVMADIFFRDDKSEMYVWQNENGWQFDVL